MTWWEAFVTVAFMSGIGAAAGAGLYRHRERTEGEIRRADFEYRTIAKQLGVDPEEVFTMGIQCAAYGVTKHDLDKVIRDWSKGND